MKYKLAIFDLDGTVLDTLADLTAAVNHALAESGYRARTENEVRGFVGNGIRLLVRRSLPDNCNDEEAERTLAAFTSYYNANCAVLTSPYAGIPELLCSLRRNGVATALVSNKADKAVQTLCDRFFPYLFDTVRGEREGIRRKPFPDAVNEVMSSLGFEPKDSVYIGDSDVDIQTAANAGTDCISVTWGFRSREFLESNGAEKLVSSVRELERELF